MLNNSAEVLRGVTGHSARAVPHLLKVMLLETGFRVSETWQTLVADMWVVVKIMAPFWVP